MIYFQKIKDVTFLLKEIKNIYNVDTIDIGALEPLLYKDEDLNIVDLIYEIEKLGLNVKMTTNGSLLYKFAKDLKYRTNVKKIRISIHSVNRDFFNKISSSLHFDNVKKSILIAKELNLPIELNCLVFRGYEEEAIDVMKFANRYNLNLKLYNLYYAPYYQREFKKYYISSRAIVEMVKNNFKDYEIIHEKNSSKRDRTILKLKNIEFIIKNDTDIDRDNKYCGNCNFINECGEQFAEYIRIDPDLKFYPCYLRKDLKFDLTDRNILENLNKFNKDLKIRLIVSAICNFKCSFPDSEDNFWCLKQGGEYKWKK